MRKQKPLPRSIVTFRLTPEGIQPLTIVASEVYSTERIAVEQREKYIVTVAPGQRWIDWWLPADPLRGCFNPFALMKGMRVRNARCFTLCAAFNDNEDAVFRVQVGEPLSMPDGAKTLSFFPNDCLDYYDNNEGSIDITVKRIS